MRTRRVGSVLRRVTAIVGVLLALALLGAGYEHVSEVSDAVNYSPPGQLVDIGGHQLHLLCVGQGTPTVVLEAAHGGTVAHWVRVQQAVADAAQATVCAYDRAGAGWSDPGPDPRDARHLAAELAALLAAADVARPVVLVAHSYGGLVARVYAAEHPRELQGVVLLEGLPPTSGRARGCRSRRPTVCRCLWRAPAWWRGSACCDSAASRRLMPPCQSASTPRCAHCKATSKFGDLLAGVERGFKASLGQARAVESLGAVPLLVVLGGASEAGDPVTLELQTEQARFSTRGALVVVPGATHHGLLTSIDHAATTARLVSDFVTATRTAPATPTR
jgi:pimeloyl-ACP methyl ester carboxylesterase